MLRIAPDLAVASGHVQDPAGRPIDGAGVYALVGEGIVAETRTDGEGRFTIPALKEGDLVAERLAAVARGCLATVVPLDPDRRSDLDIRLAWDPTHGRLEITLVNADGSPARDAHVWVTSVGRAFPPVLPTPRTDDPLALTRRLRARLELAADLADQQFEVGQGFYGISALHPDSTGRIQVAALPPGRYRVVAASRIGADGRDLPPEESLLISAYCSDGKTNGAKACVDAVVDVAPPPAVATPRFVLQLARSLEGRIVVDKNPAWGTEREQWLHTVEVEGCPWARAHVVSGSREEAGTTHVFSGRFRLEGLPRTACRLLVRTTSSAGWARDETHDLPTALDAAPDIAETQDIHVVDGRDLCGSVTWSDGSPLALHVDVRIEGYAGTTASAVVQLDRAGSDPVRTRYWLPLDRPLLGSEVAVLRLENDPVREYRLALAAFVPDRPESLEQDLVIPAVPPPLRDGSTGAK